MTNLLAEKQIGFLERIVSIFTRRTGTERPAMAVLTDRKSWGVRAKQWLHIGCYCIIHIKSLVPVVYWPISSTSSVQQETLLLAEVIILLIWIKNWPGLHYGKLRHSMAEVGDGFGRYGLIWIISLGSVDSAPRTEDTVMEILLSGKQVTYRIWRQTPNIKLWIWNTSPGCPVTFRNEQATGQLPALSISVKSVLVPECYWRAL